MKKNDKLIVVLGVIILVLASIGVFYWSPEGTTKGKAGADDFLEVTGKFSQSFEGASITVPDTDPFYPLVATPLAVHYDKEKMQEIIPMYVKNFSDPSQAIEKLQRFHLYSFEDIDLEELEYDSAKELSLELAEKYWKESEAALIIENTKEGYCLGINAVPMASYLSIPVIVCDEIDSAVSKVLTKLDVEKVIICGENLEGYKNSYSYLEFKNKDQIVENLTYIVKEKFGELDYITVTNPIDAWAPKVLDSEEFNFGPETVKSSSMNRGSLIRFVLDFFTAKVRWEFTIPDDYKYALIEFEGINHEIGGVEEYGDSATFAIDPKEGGPTLGGPSTGSGIPIRDERGNILEDRVYVERLMYDCGGKSYTISASGSWTLAKEGKVSAKVTVKKLENPVYEMMGGLSAVAPYLTAYHKGIILSDTNFAFTANDDVLTDKGQTCPGFYLAGRNPALVPMANKHVFDNIHEPINELLADLADLEYGKTSDLRELTEYYKDNPVYIALVGGATVLPRYVYQNFVEPIHDVDGDGIDDTVALQFGGGGTQSDNIYANIDPRDYDWSNEAGDIFSEYPFLENIVGRISGYDIQDADALIVRTIFYEDVINTLGQWKENFGNLFGGGVDFAKPLWVWTLNKVPILKNILSIVNTASGGFLNFAVGPWKVDTGFSVIGAQAVENEIGKDIGFNVETALHEAAMIDGFSDEALSKMKSTSFWNQLTFAEDQVRSLAGEGNVKGRAVLENSNFIWVTGHGSIYNFGMDGLDLVNAGFEGLILPLPNLWQKILKKVFSPYFLVGFWGPGGHLGKVGTYNPRLVTTVDFGPSFLWLESCFCGKITGVYPEANVGQAFINSGVNTLVASTTGSNIAGGYLEPKDNPFDSFWKINKNRRDWDRKVEQGIYPEFHFGSKIYNDMCHYLADEDSSVGKAFRDSKNQYLPEDADWELWWSPPLSAGGDTGLGFHMPAKYTSFHEYVLYGDPAFNPYVPS
jgi:hypothetical protein